MERISNHYLGVDAVSLMVLLYLRFQILTLGSRLSVNMINISTTVRSKARSELGTKLS
jgi:hypothetical protein